MNIRVLLVESKPEDVIFLKDVLDEIEVGRHWNSFVHLETTHAPTWSAAANILANQQVDVMLLDPHLPDSRESETFRHAQAAAPHVPVILLVSAEDDASSMCMLRDGAQDFLIKQEVDCVPLAHAMRSSIVRHRLLSSARAGAMNDSLTGLPNRSMFTTFADRDRKLAERLGRRLMILLAEPRNLAEIANTFGEQRRDLALVEAADHLRSILGPTDMAARIAEFRFALVMFETDVESLESVWARMHSAAEAHHIRVGAAIFDPERPVSLDTLIEQAAADLVPTVLAASQ
jgi:diguanylate cyclase (GGDEF)-like protein